MHDTFIEFLNLIGRAMIALSFIPMGLVTLKHAKQSHHKYRRRVTILYGSAILATGLSRGVAMIAIIAPSWQWVDGLFSVISGAMGLCALAYMPIALKELLRVKTTLEVQDELEETKTAVDKLTEIGEHLEERKNVSNPRQ